MSKSNTVTDLVEVLADKAKDGISKLSKLEIDDDKFKTVMENTLTCVSVVQKMTYDAQQAREQAKQNQKPKINV